MSALLALTRAEQAAVWYCVLVVVVLAGAGWALVRGGQE